jgi:mRNA interferase YafQ
MRVTQTSQLKKDAKRQRKRGRELEKIREMIDLLVTGEPLPPRYGDHSLAGNWAGWRACHLEPGWMLIYKKSEEEIILGRTGSHSDLF